MNALVDAPVIKALYRASQAGVSIDLIVRGICCLRPGVPGISDNIRVISIVDRFLEHARIFYFENGGKREVYLSSADWMPRNFQRRVEVMFPIEDEGLRDRVIDEILGIALKDNVKARQLMSDGRYVRVHRRGAADGDAGRGQPAQPVPVHGTRAREGPGRSAAARHRRHLPRASDAAGARGQPGRRRRGGDDRHAATSCIVVTAPTHRARLNKSAESAVSFCSCASRFARRLAASALTVFGHRGARPRARWCWRWTCPRW